MIGGIRDRAKRFRSMHTESETLVVCNAWDTGSAKLLASHPVVRAIGTSSAAVAACKGRPDGELDVGEVLETAAAIAAAVDKPVTVDLEAGYGDTPEQVHHNVERALQAGCSGFNLEDTDPATGELRAPAHQKELVAAAAEAVRTHNPDAVLNARTDTYWNRIGDNTAERMTETTRRLREYLSAGAGCVFVPGYPAAGSTSEQAVDQVSELVAACAGQPLNLLATPSLPLSLADLAELGVARVSYGSSLYRAVMALAVDIVDTVATTGSFDALANANDLTYPELRERVGS
jgi:2-methylisocitrate lyase-like PEP mutase family enzyme